MGSCADTEPPPRSGRGCGPIADPSTSSTPIPASRSSPTAEATGPAGWSWPPSRSMRPKLRDPQSSRLHLRLARSRRIGRRWRHRTARVVGWPDQRQPPVAVGDLSGDHRPRTCSLRPRSHLRRPQHLNDRPARLDGARLQPRTRRPRCIRRLAGRQWGRLPATRWRRARLGRRSPRPPPPGPPARSRPARGSSGRRRRGR
jgi:hypothetical protein